MQYLYSTAPETASLPRVELKTVWDARCDSVYDVTIEKSIGTSRSLHRRGGLGFILIYSVAGKGWITLGEEVELSAGNLIITTWKELRRYHCLGGAWHHWWFEFEIGGPPFFALHRPMKVGRWAGMSGDFRELFVALRQRDAVRRGGCMWRFCADADGVAGIGRCSGGDATSRGDHQQGDRHDA